MTYGLLIGTSTISSDQCQFHNPIFFFFNSFLAIIDAVLFYQKGAQP
jgi:hypothetical protein